MIARLATNTRVCAGSEVDDVVRRPMTGGCLLRTS
jgi:hypothetical protein